MFVALKQDAFAGSKFDEIVFVFRNIVLCVQEMHFKGLLHGDLKPLNLVRINGVWKLIDLDAAVLIGENALSKYSSAYVPPEACACLVPVSDDGSHNIVIKSDGNTIHLMAEPSFDIWALGCLLYQLCHPDVLPLFPSASRDDNLGQLDLKLLFHWTNETKVAKLSQIENIKARSLLSMILFKDVSKRASLVRVLAHPFLSGKVVSRLAGEEPAFDVFISYRVDSDIEHVRILYESLTKDGWKVWWDKVCLKPGENWERGFCEGLTNCRNLICVMSRNSLINFAALKPDSRQDNVLLEYRLALELQELNYI